MSMSIQQEIKRAIEYTTQGNLKKAEILYKKIVKANPENHIVLSAIGLYYLNLGQFKQAKKYLLKSYSIKQIDATTEGLGLLHYHIKENDEALKYFEKIIDKTTNFDIIDKYINLLLEKKRFTEALKLAEKCKKLYPIKKESMEKYVYCLIHVGKFKEALNECLTLTKQYPKYSLGWIRLGLIYEMYFHDEVFAKTCYENAVKCGDKYGGYSNLLINASKTFNHVDALKYIKKLDNLKIRSDDLNFTKSVVYFKHREFMKAYKYYINRTSADKEAQNYFKFKTLWDGKKYKDEILLVYSDQGIGDCLMFSRYLPFLEKYFKQIKVLTRESIINLQKRSFKQYGKIKFYSCNIKRTPTHDKSILLSSLPYILKMDIDDIPYSNGYLIEDTSAVDKYKKLINSDKFKVGICWEAGGIGWRELLNRTLNVSLFEPFFEVKNTQFYSLQVNPTMDNYKDYKNLIDLGKTFKNFDDTAGALKNLDLLITVDTSVAHLAGALGIKTFMLLPYCPDWRWFDSNKTTEWYDSIKIFRQENTKSWDDVIDNIKIELKNWHNDYFGKI